MSLPRVIDRLEHLATQYPFLSGTPAFLIVLGLLLPPIDRHYALSRDVAWPFSFLGCLGVAYCVHFHDIARLRLQQRADKLRGSEPSVVVGPFLSFKDQALQESYERWRKQGVIWNVLDWTPNPYSVLFHTRLWNAPECGMAHQVWAALASTLVLARLLYRERLSVRSYSALGLTLSAYIWVTHTVLLLLGDSCLAGFAQTQYRSSALAGTMVSCTMLIFMALMSPVPYQQYVPLKIVMGFLGCAVPSYLRLVYREHGIDFSLDGDRWWLLGLLVSLFITSMAIFIVTTALSEASLTHYLKILKRNQGTGHSHHE